jgi:hypothetical protein
VSARRLSTVDLTPEEQEHVRNALTFLRVKLDGWGPIANLLRFEQTTVTNVGNRKRTATASIGVPPREPRRVSIDDLVARKSPEPLDAPAVRLPGQEESIPSRIALRRSKSRSGARAAADPRTLNGREPVAAPALSRYT